MERVTDDSVKQQRQLDAQIERWTSDAKKLMESGKEAAALELYQRAAELARKLRQPDVAIIYFRRAATAFQIADFPKRGVAPLRTAWSLAIEGLPGSSKLLVELGLELMQLHRRLGFAADATVTFERTNAALRARGFSEIPQHTFDSQRETPSTRSFAPPRGSVPPGSKPGESRGADGPRSDVAPRGVDAAQTAPGSGSSRGNALVRIFGRR